MRDIKKYGENYRESMLKNSPSSLFRAFPTNEKCSDLTFLISIDYEDKMSSAKSYKK